MSGLLLEKSVWVWLLECHNSALEAE